MKTFKNAIPLLISLWLTASCSSPETATNISVPSTDNSVNDAKDEVAGSTESLTENKEVNPKDQTSNDALRVSLSTDPDMFFKLQNEAHLFEVSISRETEKKIAFRILVYDEATTCENEFMGKAILKEGDMESRETPEGEAVFVDQYDYEGEDCGISILLDMEDQSRAWVEYWDCEAHENECPPGADEMFHRVP